MRFGERFSYCDPQIPASAGVRPCVCLGVVGRILRQASPGSFGIFMVFLAICPLNEVGWGKVLRDSGLLRAVWGKIQLL